MGNYSEAEQNNYRKTSRSALRLFGSVSLCVYSVAISYCIYTQHYFETGLVAGATIFLTVLMGWAYKTM